MRGFLLQSSTRRIDALTVATRYVLAADPGSDVRGRSRAALRRDHGQAHRREPQPDPERAPPIGGKLDRMRAPAKHAGDFADSGARDQTGGDSGGLRWAYRNTSPLLHADRGHRRNDSTAPRSLDDARGRPKCVSTRSRNCNDGNEPAGRIDDAVDRRPTAKIDCRRRRPRCNFVLAGPGAKVVATYFSKPLAESASSRRLCNSSGTLICNVSFPVTRLGDVITFQRSPAGCRAGADGRALWRSRPRIKIPSSAARGFAFVWTHKDGRTASTAAHVAVT